MADNESTCRESTTPVDPLPSPSTSAPSHQQVGPPQGTQQAEPGSVVRGSFRAEVDAELKRRGFMQHQDPLFMHGRLHRGPQQAPKCVWRCDKPPRDDHEAPAWLTASEYQDGPAVVQAKCRELAELMRVSRRTVLYTGAGISAAVVGQAARSGHNKQGWLGNGKQAQPTFTHHALGLLGRRGWIHGWVQQNHDGLPQKAGFPQEALNEVHGSWYDPSNPVVKYTGSLHTRCFNRMVDDATSADLVLVLGTSLGGLNADQVATNAAERSLKGRALGAVCINLQQTDQDGKMSLRFFSRSDDVLKQLLVELELGPAVREIERVVAKPSLYRPPWQAAGSRALVPYDKDGRLLKNGGDGAQWMWLDLGANQKVRITPGHNIQGARQPMYMHIGSKKDSITYNGKERKTGPGHGVVTQRNESECCYKLNIEGETMSLGLWWLAAAVHGAVSQLPVVNICPEFADPRSPDVQPKTAGTDRPKRSSLATMATALKPSKKQTSGES